MLASVALSALLRGCARRPDLELAKEVSETFGPGSRGAGHMPLLVCHSSATGADHHGPTQPVARKRRFIDSAPEVDQRRIRLRWVATNG